MNGVYLLLGSNLGDRLDNLRIAEDHLQQGGARRLNESSIYETEPWGKPDQDWFLNTVLHVETFLNPMELLDLALSVEKKMGRKRLEKWGERLIDIDILYFHDEIIKTENLTLPHPSIAERRFTLVPLCELCLEEIHPLLDLMQCELLASCKDTLECRLTEFRL